MVVPAVYVDRHNHTTLAVIAGPKYVTHIPMDGRTVHRTRANIFEDLYRAMDYPVKKATEVMLESTIQRNDRVKSVLQKLKTESNPVVTEDDLTEEELPVETATETVTEKPAAKAVKSKVAASGKKPAAAKKEGKAAAKAPAKKAAAKGAAGRPSRYSDDQGIKVKVKENPFRGTLAERFAHILEGKAKTVGDYVKKTSRAGDLRFFEEKGAISIN